MLFGLIVLASIGAIGIGSSIMFNDNSYGSSLEQYIVDNQPQHSGDVERLTIEYNQRIANKEFHI